jgi:hypothetical protein
LRADTRRPEFVRADFSLRVYHVLPETRAVSAILKSED